MSSFDWIRSQSLEHARNLLSEPGSVPLGGGTDLLVAIDEGIMRPRRLVDLRGVPELGRLDWRPDGSVFIGAAVRIARLARDPQVRERLPAIAQAAESVGTPALRNMGTLGGNLCQRPRCWYWRRGIPCLKSGGTDCPAAQGENQYHAIFGGGPCFIVHPSDPAVALSALEAVIHVSGPAGGREIPAAEFFVLPRQRMAQETVLEAGEFVTGVEVPERSMGGRQSYVKMMQRGAWDFALASLATVVRRDGKTRMVLGGVAPVPWPAGEGEPVPLGRNGYKVRLVEGLMRRAIDELGGGIEDGGVANPA